MDEKRGELAQQVGEVFLLRSAGQADIHNTDMEASLTYEPF